MDTPDPRVLTVDWEMCVSVHENDSRNHQDYIWVGISFVVIFLVGIGAAFLKYSRCKRRKNTANRYHQNYNTFNNMKKNLGPVDLNTVILFLHINLPEWMTYCRRLWRKERLHLTLCHPRLQWKKFRAAQILGWRSEPHSHEDINISLKSQLLNSHQQERTDLHIGDTVARIWTWSDLTQLPKIQMLRVMRPSPWDRKPNS